MITSINSDDEHEIALKTLRKLRGSKVDEDYRLRLRELVIKYEDEHYPLGTDNYRGWIEGITDENYRECTLGDIKIGNTIERFALGCWGEMEINNEASHRSALGFFNEWPHLVRIKKLVNSI